MTTITKNKAAKPAAASAPVATPTKAKTSVKVPAKSAAKEELSKVKISKTVEAAPKLSLGKGEVAESIRTKLREANLAIPPKVASAVVDAFNETIAETLHAGGEVRLALGKFVVVNVEARKGRNPQTGEELDVPAHINAKFKASSALKKALNGEESEGDEE